MHVASTIISKTADEYCIYACKLSHAYQIELPVGQHKFSKIDQSHAG